MPYIEGIGDEVVLVVGLFLLLAVICLAWLSTQVRERPRVEVVVLDRNRLTEVFQRLRNATASATASTRTQIGYIIRPDGRRNTSEGQAGQQSGGGSDSNQTNSDQSNSDSRVSALIAQVVPESPRQDATSGTPSNDTNSEPVSPTSKDANSEPVAHTSNDTNSEPVAHTSNDTNSEPVAHTSNDTNSEPVSHDETADAELQSDDAASEETQSDTVSTSKTYTATDSSSTSPVPDPTTSEGLRQRRIAFFSRERSSIDDSQSSASSTSIEQPAEQSSTQDPPSCQAPPQTEPEVTTTTTTPPPPATSSASAPGQFSEEDRAEGCIRIRLKYLDERQRLVQSKPEDTVGQFKRLHFEGELSENMCVRLIWNGQELQGDRTLESYNIADSSVIHCLFSRVAPQGQQPRVVRPFTFDMGTLVFPLFGLILGLIWYCRFTYRSYFNAMSTFSLIGITFLFVVSFMASYRRNVRGEQHLD